MDRLNAARTVIGAGFGLALVTSLAGCGGTRGFEPAQQDTGSTIGNLIAFNKMKLNPIAPKKTDEQLSCPQIEVLDGTASMRTYAAADQSNGSVRTQFSLGDVVRECSHDGSQLVLKVGAEGRVLIGPAGQPGSFVAPVRIAIRSEKTDQVITSKLYPVSVSVPPGQTDAPFTLVSDPIAVPFVSAQADGDYTVIVGFDPQGKPSPEAGPRKHKARH